MNIFILDEKRKIYRLSCAINMNHLGTPSKHMDSSDQFLQNKCL